MRGGDPKPLSGELGQLVDRLGGKGRGSARAVAAWEGAVGPGVAHHTHVAGIRDGELHVMVDSPAWATELGAMSEQLLARLREALGETTVSKIRFTVSQEVENSRAATKRASDASRRYGGKKVQPTQLSAAQLDEIDGLFADVKDATLREAAKRAMRRDLEWKMGGKVPESRES